MLFAGGAVLAAAFLSAAPPSLAADADAGSSTAPPAGSAARKKPPRRPTTAELLRILDEQRALLEEQQRLIAEQQAKIAEQQTKIHEQDASIEQQKARLAELEEKLQSVSRRLDEVQAELPASQQQQAIEERLRRVEEASEKEPELPPTVVSAGDFPGSIRIPGTDGAIKFGGRIRTSVVFTLGPLGSDDRFVTNTIPVEPDDDAAGKGKRTSFSANTSRLNFEMRTPTGAGQMRAFLEGDFYGTDGSDNRVNFRLRHAYAQFHGLVVGQTWSTFSDPSANTEDLDFEGINGENVIRQPQVRYTWKVRDGLTVAAAAETPRVSLTGGEGVNVVPDMVGRAVWTIKETGHIQGAVVLRQIRGESDLLPAEVESTPAWGASVSGVVPFTYFDLTDRFLFQLNFGKGSARYINDLNSLGGQDAVFDPADNSLRALPATGWYLDYEHQWKEWKTTREMKLRSSLIWSFVGVDNFDFQPDDAYRRTNRYSINLVFSPTPRIDVGTQYIYGTRENKDGHKGSSDQVQAVGIFRF